MSSIAMEKKVRHKILIVDDSVINRAILTDMLGDEYEIIEAENGVQAVAILQKRAEIALVLLDFIMPEMDGFAVLDMMNRYHWIDEIPVIMISSENAPSHIARAYELGITDFITRPFDVTTVRRRVINTILLYAKQKKLMDLVAEQIYEKEKNSSLMIDILSHIVEFRNGESGLHVLHIRILTELLLKALIQRTGKYDLKPMEISVISTASALHDIGKIAIKEEILNKPGRLTEEEFEIMKTHTTLGASMLDTIVQYQREPLYEYAYEICRWHHERYDGGGYPDGLKGDEIPISAQVVALADVYDALSSKRVYKDAFSHETSIQMILDGKCGCFNPLLLECLKDVSDILEEELQKSSVRDNEQRKIQGIVGELLENEKVSAADRSLQLLELEREKYNFFASMSEEIQFEFALRPTIINFSAWGAKRLELPENIINPLHNPDFLNVVSPELIKAIKQKVRTATPDNPSIQCEGYLTYKGQMKWSKVICKIIWSQDEKPRILSLIGKIQDINEEQIKIRALEQAVSIDHLTGLHNRSYAEEHIRKALKELPNKKFAMAMIDMDRFKSLNDTHGHLYGDKILRSLSDKLKKSIRSTDISARVGGDEFLFFVEYKDNAEELMERIFKGITRGSEEYYTVSMGVARTEVGGRDYTSLYHAADQALYHSKRKGGNQYCFYEDFMKMPAAGDKSSGKR